MRLMQQLELPPGFEAAGVYCGIKEAAVEDLTLIHCPRSAVAAGVYTQNLVYAAPVEVCRERTPSERFRAVVINSGNANACTGAKGLADAREMVALTADAVGGDPDSTLVLSTGVIGQYLPMDAIRRGIQAAREQLGTSPEHLQQAARGMLTTDKGPKVAGGVLASGIRITGLAKGAGMIGPRMATMLSVLMTDANIDAPQAHLALTRAVDESFHCISVEGHTSTNDTVLLLASGATDRPPLSGNDLREFGDELTRVAIELAKQIPDDGEGATHLIAIEIQGCTTAAAGRQIAKTIAESALVKTAITGSDPNWGRIVSAAGYAGVPLDPTRIGLHINGFEVYRDGAPTDFDARQVSGSMRENRETRLRLTLAEGSASARFWTSDLTVEYVQFNADYHT